MQPFPHSSLSRTAPKVGNLLLRFARAELTLSWLLAGRLKILR